jgi:hypothetical protein
MFLDSRFPYASNVKISKVNWNVPFHQPTCTRTAGLARPSPPFFLNFLALINILAAPSNLVPFPKHRPRFSPILRLRFLPSSPLCVVAGITYKALASSPPKALLYRFGHANLALKKAHAGTDFRSKMVRVKTMMIQKRWMWKSHTQRNRQKLLVNQLIIQEKELMAAYGHPMPINVAYV